MDSGSSEYHDLTPEWFNDYSMMLDVVYPQREETLIFDLEESDTDFFNQLTKKEMDE